MNFNTTCNCSALISNPNSMCRRCKLEYIKWSTGFNERDIVWLAKGVTAAERVRKLKDGLKKQSELRKLKQPILKLVP